jgi:serine phosphatase RsbU (regulator of sigma subunit)
VRYQPATERARVGGDWYDAFTGPDGSLLVAVGDVTGHDQWAAAAMAQIRNLLRGIAYRADAGPALVLAHLDSAMEGLAVGLYATAVLAAVRAEERVLRWSNAGHPPPVLVAPDGRAQLLQAQPEPLLGLGAPGPRSEHALAVEPGSTVVFYTDGLVERRPIPLQERLAWLTGVLEGSQDRDPDSLCDHVLAQLDGPTGDDIALLVLRVA